MVRFSDFFDAVRQQQKKKNADRIIASCRARPLSWRVRADYEQATSRAEGRARQGGAKRPYMVKLSALKDYYAILQKELQ